MPQPFASLRAAGAARRRSASARATLALALLLALARAAVAAVCGDADGNGVVTVTDGVLALRAAAGLASSCSLSACDIDGSSAITVTDGVDILRMAAGLPVAGDCGSAPVANVQPLSVDPGPTGGYTNGVFTDVTICLPNDPATCQTIPDVLVDSGSVGVRILSSVLTLSLPQTTQGGAALAECLPFVDGITWGPVRSADVRLAGERASAIPVQVVGDPSFSSIPDGCATSGMPPLQNVEALGANGVLGIASFRLDCGDACAATDASNPGIYYACEAGGCTPTAVALAQQIPNPVWKFPADNTGVVIELPGVPAAGAASIAGSLTIGVGTQADNALGSATVLGLAADGTFTTVYQGEAFDFSIIDSGSNAFYFLDPTATGIPSCRDARDFYCPASTLALKATNLSADGSVSIETPFDVANTDALFAANPDAFVFGNLAGPNPGSFDWGLPLFFGRKVFIAIEGQETPGGTGPFVAY